VRDFHAKCVKFLPLQIRIHCFQLICEEKGVGTIPAKVRFIPLALQGPFPSTHESLTICIVEPGTLGLQGERKLVKTQLRRFQISSCSLLHQMPKRRSGQDADGRSKNSAPHLANWKLLLATALIFWHVLDGPAQVLQSVSVADPAQQPAGGSGDSGVAILSSDGRYVLFASTANNLEGLSAQLFPIIPPRINVFLRDRTNGVTTLISVNTNGTGGGNGDSLPVDVSTNGRYVLFESSASDLATGDTNNSSDVFVRDLQTGTTTLVSVATNGLAGNGFSRSPAMTPDGRYVAFVSAANNLVVGDTNGIGDVFVRDLQTGVTTLVSQGAQARTGATSFIFSTSETPSITPDGRYVLFMSEATNLVSGVPGTCHVYLRDVVAGQTTWVSSHATNVVQSTTAICFNPIMSLDGRYVVYVAATNASTRGFILYYDVQTSQSSIVHSNATVAREGYEDIRTIDMTPDGRFVAFVANTNGTSGTQTCICVWDAQPGTLDVPSLDLNSQVPANSVCGAPGFDSSGRFVVFLSNGSNLATNSTGGGFHAYLRDRQLGITALLDADTNGVGTALSPSVVPQLSADRHLVAFECPDGNLFPNDRNRNSDLIVHDIAQGTNELISLPLPELFTATPNGPSTGVGSSVSSNGLLMAFSSDADNLVANDTNSRPDIFVRDIVAGTNLLVSVDTNGFPSDGASYETAISADGRYVAFTSSADNLVPNDGNRTFDVFRRDLLTGTTELVSVSTDGISSANGNSRAPVLVGNGRYVLFLSAATDLAPGAGIAEKLFCRDMVAGKTFALTTNGYSAYSASRDNTFVAVAGINGGLIAPLAVWDCANSSWVYSNGVANVGSLKISPNGQRIAYLTFSSASVHLLDWATGTDRTIGQAGGLGRAQFTSDGNLFVYNTTTSQLPIDTNAISDIYLYDFQFGTNSLISRSYLGGAANGISDSPDVSADGRFIVYRSVATNIVPNDLNGEADVFIYDRVTQTTTLLSASRFGNRSGSHVSMAPHFSADGNTLLFESWASDLVPHDFNATGDVFAYGLSGGSSIPVFYAKITPDLGATKAWWVTWPASQGNTYRVQYKHDLADTWQYLPGNVTILGGQGFLRDPGPVQTQRFYRVVASEP
jgi:Tol biopolymer transport system component